MPPAQDTRARIQEVALELFTEQGYENTSLREVAERLGVTKAALYYHFKSKDEIVESIAGDRVAALEDLVAWARTQPRTLAVREELLRRYRDELFQGRRREVMRFLERNQTVVKKLPAAERMRDLMSEMVDLLADPDATPKQRLKASLALFALHAAVFVLGNPAVSDEERREVAFEVALELIGEASPDRG
jgi:AcrR family transcriptional regulator